MYQQEASTWEKAKQNFKMEWLTTSLLKYTEAPEVLAGLPNQNAAQTQTQTMATKISAYIRSIAHWIKSYWKGRMDALAVAKVFCL